MAKSMNFCIKFFDHATSFDKIPVPADITQKIGDFIAYNERDSAYKRKLQLE